MNVEGGRRVNEPIFSHRDEGTDHDGTVAELEALGGIRLVGPFGLFAVRHRTCAAGMGHARTGRTKSVHVLSFHQPHGAPLSGVRHDAGGVLLSARPIRGCLGGQSAGRCRFSAVGVAVGRLACPARPEAVRLFAAEGRSFGVIGRCE